MNGSFPKNLPRLEKGRCHRGSGPLAIRDASQAASCLSARS